jgi:site-specific DNA recombinase
MHMVEARKQVRCAVYTRKSTEDGLEQEYNSLDAQYDACAAYVLSQRHEGWTLVKDRYDDGGFSGGNMNRPSLGQLLAEVRAGKVDIILLYKIDRLTRSLSDFARIVDVLDAAGASFVSITQSFNTTTSMGRLTLNMLLSFAQFEREVTGERIRDKIAASKRKGIWMGGPVPLGYDVVERKLVPNEQEARTVRHIMLRYVVLGSVKALVAELDAEGFRTKIQIRTSTANKGGCPFRRGTLYHLLSNRIYRGEIVHKGVSYAGEHEPIVSQDLWDRVQTALCNRSQGGASRHGAKHPSLLAGMIRDGEGRDMTPSHTTNGNRRYRYYVTRPEQVAGKAAWRVNAHDLEHLVCRTIVELLQDQRRLAAIPSSDVISAQAIIDLLDKARMAASSLNGDSIEVRKGLLGQLAPSITLKSDGIAISIKPYNLMAMLEIATETVASDDSIDLRCDAVRIRRGHEVRLIIAAVDGQQSAKCDTKLVALVAEARAAVKLLSEHPGQSLAAVANQYGRCRTRLGKLIELSCLAPDIVTAIANGTQSATLDSKTLMSMHLPLNWNDQRKKLGFS